MKLEDIRAEIFRRKPQFARMVDEWGTKTLLDYYTQEFLNRLEPSVDVLNALYAETVLIFGDGIGHAVRDSVAHQQWTNTADHHGLLFHPYFYTTALARSHTAVRKGDTVTVTLPFGGVSLGNDSFPRGFYFHDSVGHIQRVFFKSLKKRRLPVYALVPMTRAALEHERDRTLPFSLSKDARDRLYRLFTELLMNHRVWEQETYSQQLTAMNQVLWQELFGTTRGDFVYLEIDSVVRRLFIEKHLVKETPVYTLLFNAEWRTAFSELFSGVQGSHSEATGTHLFWYIDYAQEKHRQLRIKHDTLTTMEGDIVIPLTPESIAEGLQTRTLMPSTALLLIVLQGVEGLACGGGSSQLQYLPEMMNRWQELLGRFGQTATIPTTSIWCGDNNLYQIANTHTGKDTSATLIDTLLYKGDIRDTIDQTLSNTTIRGTVEAMIPTLYTLYIREHLNQKFHHSIPHISIS